MTYSSDLKQRLRTMVSDYAVLRGNHYDNEVLSNDEIIVEYLAHANNVFAGKILDAKLTALYDDATDLIELDGSTMSIERFLAWMMYTLKS